MVIKLGRGMVHWLGILLGRALGFATDAIVIAAGA